MPATIFLILSLSKDAPVGLHSLTHLPSGQVWPP